MNNLKTAAPRTDMALELLKDKRAANCRTTVTDGQYGLKRTAVLIGDEAAAREIGKPVGNYYTVEIETPYKRPAKIRAYAAREIAGALSEALRLSGGSRQKPDKLKTVFVACLGNKNMAADALGPYVMEKLIVTRHLFGANEPGADKMGNLCALSPGVLGITGIETYDVLAALVDRIKPGAVIAVDTLASGSTARLASAFQIADSGITPGAGVGNRRLRLSRETLNVPVIAVGVPLVVYASTIVNEVFEEYFRGRKRGENRAAAERATAALLGDAIVTLKDIDVAVKECADILALAVNMAVHGLTAEEAAGLMR
ncbi:MAG: GPR endopeptidase [Clostridiales bacterium]|jgi:spore protease|nr:GPR endopeptidase [Clostridiales bacterium]